MEKRIIDLTHEDIRRFLFERCPEYINHECHNCPLDIYGNCYVDIKERIEETIEVKENDL